MTKIPIIKPYASAVLYALEGFVSNIRIWDLFRISECFGFTRENAKLRKRI